MDLRTKVMVASMAAALVLPVAASAHGSSVRDMSQGEHEDNGLHLGLQVHVGERDRDEDGHAEHAVWHATTTAGTSSAAAITRRASRIQATADVMGSFSSMLAARIASSSMSTSSTAQADALLADYTGSLGGAKINASAALSAAAQMGSTTDSSLLGTLAQQARSSLKAAHDLLKQARIDLMAVVRLIAGN